MLTGDHSEFLVAVKEQAMKDLSKMAVGPFSKPAYADCAGFDPNAWTATTGSANNAVIGTVGDIWRAYWLADWTVRIAMLNEVGVDRVREIPKIEGGSW